MTLRIALVTNAIYSRTPRFVKITDNLKQAYCQAQDIKFVRLHDNPHRDLHPVWCKPRVLLNTLYDYDCVVWMDCDAAPLNKDFDLRHFIAGQGDRVIMQRDINGWNAGVFSVPHTDDGLAWLQYIEDRRNEPQYQHRFREQQAMADSFAGEWGRIVTEPPQHIGWNSYLHIYNRTGDKNIYKPGHWCLHLPAVDNARRAELFEGLA